MADNECTLPHCIVDMQTYCITSSPAAYSPSLTSGYSQPPDLGYNQHALVEAIGCDLWADINARGMQASSSMPSTALQLPDIWSGTISPTAEYSNVPGILSSRNNNSNIGATFIPGINEYEDPGNNSHLCHRSAGISSLEISTPLQTDCRVRYHKTGAAANTAVSSSSKKGQQDLGTKTCQFCHRTFSRPSSLKIHMNSHTGGRPFHCPVPGCNKAYLTNSNVNRHIKKLHGVDALEAIRQPPPYGSQFKYEELPHISSAPRREAAVHSCKEQDKLFIHSNPSSLALASC